MAIYNDVNNSHRGASRYEGEGLYHSYGGTLIPLSSLIEYRSNPSVNDRDNWVLSERETGHNGSNQGDLLDMLSLNRDQAIDSRNHVNQILMNTTESISNGMDNDTSPSNSYSEIDNIHVSNQVMRNTSIRNNVFRHHTSTSDTSAYNGLSDHNNILIKHGTVYLIYCRECQVILSERGTRAVLLTNSKVELFSTDEPLDHVAILDRDYASANCGCKMRDIGCRQCGNILGYHVSCPCMMCMKSCNNGHTWIFNTNSTKQKIRRNRNKENVIWKDISYPHDKKRSSCYNMSSSSLTYENFCR